MKNLYLSAFTAIFIVFSLLSCDLVNEPADIDNSTATVENSTDDIYGGGLFDKDPKPKPPGKPLTGYGSEENYICNNQSVVTLNNSYNEGVAGKKVYIYIPEVLKNGDNAPVVVFIHGFMAISPLIYMDHIKHLTKQGNIVIFPQFNKEYTGMVYDMDQEQMLHRAIVSTNQAMDYLGDMADPDNVTVYGHSVGGLLSLCWSDGAEGEYGPEPKNIILANPQIDPTVSGMPEFIVPYAQSVMTFLDWENKAAATICPVIIVTGNEDTMATPEMAVSIFNVLVNASSKALYVAMSDYYGAPDLVSDHMSCLGMAGVIPEEVLFYFGSFVRLDSMDWRVYWAALDAGLDGQTNLSFDMGSWSDGKPVADVEIIVSSNAYGPEEGPDTEEFDSDATADPGDLFPIHDLGKKGSYETVTISVEIENPYDNKIHGSIYAPSTDDETVADGVFPLIIMTPGFSTSYALYYDYAQHLASYGYIVLGVDFPSSGFLDPPEHERNANEIILAIDYAISTDSPIAGKVDVSKIGAMGHSKGAKMAFYAAALDSRINLIMAMDPQNVGGAPCFVCNIMGTDQCHMFPVAPNPKNGDEGMLGDINAAALVFIAPPDKAVTPEEEFNAHYFYDGMESNALGMHLNAGHVSWLYSARIKRITKRTMVAWVKKHWDGEEGMDAYLTGDEIQEDLDDNVITKIETK